MKLYRANFHDGAEGHAVADSLADAAEMFRALCPKRIVEVDGPFGITRKPESAAAEVLRKVEWCRNGECPWCGCDSTDGHAVGCKLAEVLAGAPVGHAPSRSGRNLTLAEAIASSGR